jgi:hypothetical protein
MREVFAVLGAVAVLLAGRRRFPSKLLLVYCPIKKFTDALDFRENRIGGRGPDERSFVCIVVCDILLDFVDQLTDVAQRATAHRLLGDESEPAFDLVEPA